MAQGTSGIATREPRTRGKTTFLEFSSKVWSLPPPRPTLSRATLSTRRLSSCRTLTFAAAGKLLLQAELVLHCHVN